MARGRSMLVPGDGGKWAMELAKARGVQARAAARRACAGRRAGGAGHHHAFAVPGESYLDVLDGLYAVRDKLQARHLPVRGGGREHGRGLRQADRPPGRGVRHARARRLPRRHRRACGDAGQHAAAAVRRPDPVRGNRPRELPGSRLPPDVPAAGEMGDADRRCRAHPGAGGARGGCRHHRPARPGGDRAVGGDAEAHGGGARYRPAPRCPAPHPDPAAIARLQAMLAASRASRWRSSAAAAGARRAARRSATSSPAHDIPVTVGFRRQALYDGTLRQLCRRPRRRLRPGAGRQGARRRPDPGDRHPAGRGGDARATRCSTPPARRRSSTSIRTPPRSAACSARRSASSPTSTPSPPRSRELPPATVALARLDARAARDPRSPATAVPDYPGPLNLAAGHARSWRSCSSRDAIMTCDAGNFADLAAALHAFHATASASSARPTARWATACRRRSAPRSPSRTGRSWPSSAMAAS